MVAAWVALIALTAVAIVIVVVAVPWSAPAARSEQLAALNSLPSDAVAHGREFRSQLRPSGYLSMLISLAVALLLGLTPLGAKLIGALGSHWLVRAVLGGVVLAAISQLVVLPLSAWRESIVRRYELSTRDWGSWAVDVVKAFVVEVVLVTIVLLAFYTLTRLAPRWWWAIGAAGAAALVVVMSLVFPVLIEPIFNKFTPMEPSPLRTSLMQLAERDGLPVRDVLVADASRRTKAVNAYVSGIGPTRRIVVYDTLLNEAPPAEVLSVAAHELGHVKANDVRDGTLLGALAAAIAVIGLYLLGQWEWLLQRAGIDSIADPRSAALLFAIVAIVGLIAAPVQNLISRNIEARADQHALQLTDDPETFTQMQTRLSRVNLSDPDPPRIEYWLFSSHPSTVERIAAARTWRQQ